MPIWALLTVCVFVLGAAGFAWLAVRAPHEPCPGAWSPLTDGERQALSDKPRLSYLQRAA
jgi:hypothetical protein